MKFSNEIIQNFLVYFWSTKTVGWTFHQALTSFFYTGAVKEYNMYHYNMITQNLQVLKGVKEKYFANT